MSERECFRFKAARRQIWLGIALGVAVLGGIASWAWLTGRLRNADATYGSIMLACGIGSISLVGWQVLAGSRRTALAMGKIELDAGGIRWRYGDDTVALEASWDLIERATVDRPNRRILLQRRDADHFLITAGSGYVELERFHDLERLIALQVPVEPYSGSPDGKAARRPVLYGAVSILSSLTLYAVNLGLSTVTHWTRLLAVMPALIGAVGFITLIAGLRIRSGRSPSVSPLYEKTHPRLLVRFLAVALIGNFIIIAAFNMLRP